MINSILKNLRLGLAASLCAVVLAGCSGSSSSGSALDMNGTWVIYPHSTSTAVVFNNFRATLTQSGSSVSSTEVVAVSPPGAYPCASGPITITGSVAGNTFNGIMRRNTYQASFSVSGTSSSLSGTFTINYTSGPCAGAGTVVGNATMTKV